MATSGKHCSKAVTLLNKIDETHFKDGIDWCSLISSGLDNTNANIGSKNSLKSRILEKNSSFFEAGCNCHLVHLVADKRGQAFPVLVVRTISVISIIFKRQLQKKRNLN